MTAISLDEHGLPLHSADGRLVENPGSCITLALLDGDRNEFLGPCVPGALASPDLPMLSASPG
jgi:hypothetical protein